MSGPETAAGRQLVDWTWLANVVRHIDGDHDLGAGEFAERLVVATRPFVELAERQARAAAVARDCGHREAWENAKRTKLSTMHDVGGCFEVVDALLSAPSPVREPVTLEPPPVTVASGVIEKVLPVREPEGLDVARVVELSNLILDGMKVAGPGGSLELDHRAWRERAAKVLGIFPDATPERPADEVDG